MKETCKELSGYRGMWVLTMFDLPVTTKQARHEYATFRTSLLKLGFHMLQFSVYMRYCGSEERAEIFRQQIRQALPPSGQIRVLSVTDHQFGKMQVFMGKTRLPPEEPPRQLLLF